MASKIIRATTHDATFGAVTVTRRTDRAFTHAVIRVADDGAVSSSFHMTRAAADRAAGRPAAGVTRHVVSVGCDEHCAGCALCGGDSAPTAPTITELPAAADIGAAMRSELNRGVMVAWINADLLNRADCDVRRSVVLYDADRVFVMALGAAVTADVFRARVGLVADSMARAGIRYWSVGIA